MVGKIALSGTETVSNDVQPSNAWVPMVTPLPGITTFVKLVQFINAEEPTFVTLDGMEMVDNSEQL